MSSPFVVYVGGWLCSGVGGMAGDGVGFGCPLRVAKREPLPYLAKYVHNSGRCGATQSLLCGQVHKQLQNIYQQKSSTIKAGEENKAEGQEKKKGARLTWRSRKM